MLKGIEKYANKGNRVKASSPKLQVYNTALLSAQSGKSFKQAIEDRDFWGRLTESAIGAYIINEVRGKQIDVFYWREGNREVDFVLKKDDFIVAIEVKSSLKKEKLPAMDAFKKQFHASKLLLVGKGGVPIEEFLQTPIENWFC